MFTYMGIKVVPTQYAVELRLQLSAATKEFTTPEYRAQFNDWSRRAFGVRPCLYVLQDGDEKVIVAHPDIVEQIKQRPERYGLSVANMTGC